MAIYYTFDLDNGAQLHANPASTVCLPGGSTKTPDQVVEGDRVCFVDDIAATVTAITTTEV